MSLGYGMSSYFSLMLQLFMLMVFICLFAFPLMWFYSENTSLQQYPGFMISKFSLGNLGGASVQCFHAMYTSKGSRFDIMCPSGLIELNALGSDNGKPVFDAGIIQASSELKNYCAASSFDDPYGCSSYFKQEAFRSELMTSCQGRESCTIRDLTNYMDTGNAKMNQTECATRYSTMYVQVGCLLTQ